MAKKIISFNENQIILTDDKNQSEKIDLLEIIDDAEAIFAIRKEQKAGQKASQGALTLLVHMLDNPKFDAYKGTTPQGEKITPEFRGALRDLEIEFMKPLFCASLQAKGNTPATIEKEWQGYSAGLRQGTYAMVKSYVSKFFCHLGKLPLADNGKLLPINAIKQILANAETPKESAGLAGKLVAILTDLETKEAPNLGDLPTALAALHKLTQHYKSAEAKLAEALTAQGNIFADAKAVIAKAGEKPSMESIEAMHENGQIDDVTFQIMMLEHHNVEITFED